MAFHIPAKEAGHGVIDLTKIDFEALAKRFGKSKNQEYRPGATEGGRSVPSSDKLDSPEPHAGPTI